MSAKKEQSSLDIRNLVISHYKSGKSQRKIAEIVKKSRSTVEYIIRRFKDDGRIANKPKKSTRKAFSEADERYILRKIRGNPALSAPKLTAEVNNALNKDVNPETVRRVLRKHGFNGRVARWKPHISKTKMKKRLQFALKYVTKDNQFWTKVLFTDESKFNIFGSDGRRMIWRKKNTELDIKNIQPTVKHGGGSCMVWGCMSANGTGELEFIRGSMDKLVYLNILKKNVKQSAQSLGIGEGFAFYQDNDPKLTSNIARQWLIYNCKTVLDVPPQSPDLNVIENLWDTLEKRIRNYQISCKTDLENALTVEWAKITPEYTTKLVESMQSRLKAVIEAKGGPTRY